jgi:hypothetical protein
VTKDYEVKDRSLVIVKQKTVITKELTWTLAEIDYYIGTLKTKIETMQGALKEFLELRQAVETEAKKVKLDTNHDPS